MLMLVGRPHFWGYHPSHFCLHKQSDHWWNRPDLTNSISCHEIIIVLTKRLAFKFSWIVFQLYKSNWFLITNKYVYNSVIVYYMVEFFLQISLGTSSWKWQIVENINILISLKSYLDHLAWSKFWACYAKLLLFLPAILILACASISPPFLMMSSAQKLNKQGDNIQPWRTPFPIWNQSVVPCPVLTVASWPAYGFLKRQVRWSGIPISFRIFHSFLWSTQSKALA